MRYVYRWGFVWEDDREYKYVLKYGFVFREPRYSEFDIATRTPEIIRHTFVNGAQMIRFRPGQIIDCNLVMDLVAIGTQGCYVRRKQ